MTSPSARRRQPQPAQPRRVRAKGWLAGVLVVAGAMSGVEASSAEPASPAHRYVVVLKPSAMSPADVASEHSRRYGAQVDKLYGSAINGYAAAIPDDRVEAMRADNQVLFVSPDVAVHAQGQTVGTGVSRIGAANKANNGAAVDVAVLDTGIDTTHPDLAANIAGGRNCSQGGKGYSDVNGHGTHVAGIIAAGDNGTGVVGVAPEARLWAVRVLDKNASGPISDVICGVDFVDSMSPARGGPITVANLSLGAIGADDGQCGTTNADALHLAICRAVDHGVTFVVAAGNSGMDLSQAQTFVPAAYDEVITVSALSDSDGRPCGTGAATTYGADDDFAYFSNFATSAGDLAHLVAAPGAAIYSTWAGGGYKTSSGTSMASPHVAGAAALYVAAHPGVSPAGVRAGLQASAEAATNFNGECTASGGGKRSAATSGMSHIDSSGRHPEAVIRTESL